MSYQEQGAQMTEWDLNLLEKKFALKQAEIALEEAQNAKREVRLTRDSQGNYGYVYTANEEEVNKAQQNMEDALFDL
jgi:N-acetylmuramoyl-L-alanine amidase